jgi:hypothetical protein
VISQDKKCQIKVIKRKIYTVPISPTLSYCRKYAAWIIYPIYLKFTKAWFIAILVSGEILAGSEDGQQFSSEKLDDKILRKYVRLYIDDIFVYFGDQPSIHLVLINIPTCQYFFNIFQYLSKHQ